MRLSAVVLKVPDVVFDRRGDIRLHHSPHLRQQNFLGLFWEIKFENGHVEVIRDISVLVVFIQDADKFIR